LGKFCGPALLELSEKYKIAMLKINIDGPKIAVVVTFGPSNDLGGIVCVFLVLFIP